MLVILVLTRRMADTPPEDAARGSTSSAPCCRRSGLGLIVYGILRSGTWGFVQPKAGAPAWLGLSPVIWLILAGGVVLWLFLWWENHRLGARRGRARRPGDAAQPGRCAAGSSRSSSSTCCRPGCSSPCRCSCRWRSGCRRSRPASGCCRCRSRCCWPRSACPKVFPHASPRRVVQIGFLALFAGIVVMVAALDVGAGPEIVTWPMLLAGLGVGALASQLGSVTVSSVPDEQSGEVGGVQNTMTNLGASIGTALAGAVLISALTASFLSGIQNNPAVPDDVVVPGAGRAGRRRPVRLRRGPEDRARQGRRTAGDRRRHRRGERERPHRRAARIAVGARRHRADRAVLQPPDPDPAALRSTRERARGLIIRPGTKAPCRAPPGRRPSAPLCQGHALRSRVRDRPGSWQPSCAACGFLRRSGKIGQVALAHRKR